MTDAHQPPSPRALLQRLESLRGAGVTQLARCEGRPYEPPPAEAPVPAATRPSALGPTPPPPAVGPSRAAAPPTPAAQPSTPEVQPPAAGPPVSAGTAPQGVSSAPTLEVLQNEVAGCTACGELAATRTQTVFGVGNPKARLCFMGEAPGADEDRLGEPFVGKAGQLLTKMLQACRLERDDVYILNVLKCRPPGNRNPAPEEAGNCRGFLMRQLELIDPEYVCCLGAVAAQNFLETTTPIGRLRGSVHQHAGRKVVCTYHPAYLLRNPSAKKPAWDDLKMLMRELGVEL